MTHRPAQTLLGRSTRVARGLCSALVLVAVTGGYPLLLYSIAAIPIPDMPSNWQELQATWFRPDDGTLLLGFLTLLAWVAWVVWVVMLLLEVAGQFHGRHARRIRGLEGPQQLVALLITGLGAAVIGASMSLSRASSLPPSPSSLVVATAPITPDSTSTVLADGDQATVIVASNGRQPGLAPPSLHVIDRAQHVGLPQEADGLSIDSLEQHQIVVRFAFGAARLSVTATEGLDAAAHDIHERGDPRLPIRIVGHTDGLGPSSFNQRLSLRRAQSVRNALHQRLGQLYQYQVSGQGETAPIATETSPDGRDDPAGRARNRRVEITYSRQTAHMRTPPSTPQQPRTTASRPPGELTGSPTPEPSNPGQPGEHPHDEQFHLTAPAGYGALLAAGILALLAARRVIQQRRRKPGHRIRMPRPASQLEQQMRRHAEPGSVDLLDQALRSLAAQARADDLTLPHLAGARVTPTDVELFLAESAPAIPPFRPIDQKVWRLDQRSPALRNTETVRDTLAPYPSLVTLGQDEDGSHVLVDLEQAGAISLTGTTTHVCEVLAALGIELATSSWADHLIVTCVAFANELPRALGTGRLRHVNTVDEALTEIEARSRDVADVLTTSRVESVREARSRQLAGDAWTPEIILSADPLTDAEQKRLSSLVLSGQATSLAAVVAATGDHALPGPWRLDATPPGPIVLGPISAHATLQRITAEEYRQLLADLRVTDDNAGIPAPGWGNVPAEPELPPEPLPTPHGHDDVKPSNGHPHPAGIETIPGTKAEKTPPPPDPDAPEIRILGRVEVAGRDQADVEPGKRNLLVELAAFLTLNPGCTAADVSNALGGPRGPWAPSTRASNMSRLRAWFGRDSEGRNYVPALGEGQLYTVTGRVSSDWQRFQELAARGLASPPNLDDLQSALALVRGKPLSGSSPARYVWAEHLKQEIISAVVDVAHTVAVSLTEAGQPAAARKAIAKGLDVEPVSELLYRDLFRAEHRAGNIVGITHAAQRLMITLDQIGLEMEPETAELLEELLRRHPQPRRREV